MKIKLKCKHTKDFCILLNNREIQPKKGKIMTDNHSKGGGVWNFLSAAVNDKLINHLKFERFTV